MERPDGSQASHEDWRTDNSTSHEKKDRFGNIFSFTLILQKILFKCGMIYPFNKTSLLNFKVYAYWKSIMEGVTR